MSSPYTRVRDGEFRTQRLRQRHDRAKDLRAVLWSRIARCAPPYYADARVWAVRAPRARQSWHRDVGGSSPSDRAPTPGHKAVADSQKTPRSPAMLRGTFRAGGCRFPCCYDFTFHPTPLPNQMGATLVIDACSRRLRVAGVLPDGLSVAYRQPQDRPSRLRVFRARLGRNFDDYDETTLSARCCPALAYYSRPTHPAPSGEGAFRPPFTLPDPTRPSLRGRGEEDFIICRGACAALESNMYVAYHK